MMKSPSTKLMAAAAVVVFAVVAAIASASNSATPGVRNGVVTACVEPATQGNKATSGDLNVLACLKGAKKISWNIRGPRGPAGPAGAHGSQGPAGAKGDTGATGPPGARGATGATGLAGATGVGGPGAVGPPGAIGPKGDTGATGPPGPGNTIQSDSGRGVILLDSPVSAYQAPDVGTAPTVTVEGAHTVLLTITTACTASDVGSSCFMSFTANGGATLAGDDSRAAGGVKSSPVSGPAFAGSASFVVTTTGTTTFTGVYKNTVGMGTFSASTIIAQVYP